MRAFFHPDQRLHDPQQFMRVGRISEPKDLPSRTAALLGALDQLGITPETPADYGPEPAAGPCQTLSGVPGGRL